MALDSLQKFVEQRLKEIPKSKPTDDIRTINIRFGRKQELEAILQKLKELRRDTR